MSEKITLELPDKVIERARAEAERSGNPLESVLTEWLEHEAEKQDIEQLLKPDHEYIIYTPLESYEAAGILERALREHQESKRKKSDGDT